MDSESNDRPEVPKGIKGQMALNEAHVLAETCARPGSSNAGNFVEPKQSAMFPFDAWGADHVVAVVYQPHTKISRAMIGPISIGQMSAASGGELRCLAVSSDGLFAFSANLPAALLDDPISLWNEVSNKLIAARQGGYVANNRHSNVVPIDCLTNWSRATFWIPNIQNHDSVRAFSKLVALHEYGANTKLNDDDWRQIELKAQAAVVEHVSTSVLHVLGALHPELLEIISTRRTMSISMACHLVLLTNHHIGRAGNYALQALRTESYGVLDLITSGWPEVEATQIRNAIFSGQSVPSAFENIGVAKAVYRRTVSKPMPSYNRRHERERGSGMYDLYVSGEEWLVAMRLQKYLPLHGDAHWIEFAQLMQRLKTLNLLRSPCTEKLVQWCANNGYKNSRSRLDSLIEVANEIASRVRNEASQAVDLDDAIAMALMLADAFKKYHIQCELEVVLNFDDCSEITKLLAHLKGQSVGEMLDEIIKSQPAVPLLFPAYEGLAVYSLDGHGAVEMHGTQCGNCLAESDRMAQYYREGIALYGVRYKSDIAGTIALRYDSADCDSKVQVQEVTGAHNEMASFDLCRLAQSLAESWVEPYQLGEWAIYESKCSAWRRQVFPKVVQFLFPDKKCI
jgi:hypothetical protein